MMRFRQWLTLVLMSLTALVGAGLLRPTQPVAAATYPDQTLVGDLHLPQQVVAVMVANSLDATGKTPSVAPAAVTVADVQQWQTVALAARTQNADGTYTSATAPTVASWVASLATTTDEYVATKDMLLAQDLSDGSYSAAGLLDGSSTISVAYNRTQPYTTANLPIFNVLMAVMMSATKAKTIDLTGIVSQVASPANRVKMLALFQTKTLPHLETLDLGYNLFGQGVTSNSWYYTMFRTRTLASSSVVTWNLPYEELESLDADLLSSLGSQTRNINLASNVLTTLNYNNRGYLGTGGKIDLSNNDNLDSVNSDTFIVLATIISTGGNTILPDAVANAVVTKALENWPNISNLGVNAMAPQLTTATLAAIANMASIKQLVAALDPSKLLASSVQGLTDADYQKLYDSLDATQKAALAAKRAGGGGGKTARLNADGAWTFANYRIGQPDAVVGTGSTPVIISGSLPPNQQLTVAMSAWTNGNSQIAPLLSLPAGTGGWQAVNLEVGQPEVVLSNPNDNRNIGFEQLLRQPLLTVPNAQLNKLRAGQNYTGTLTWTIQNTPTTDYAMR